MKKQRPIEIEEGREVAGKTIVGGRPMARRHVRMNIPAGIEKTLYKAAIDPDFRALLQGDRDEALRASGFELTAVEAAMLRSIPDSRLEHMIGTIQPARHGRRKFMRAVATAVVSLASTTAVVGCEENIRGATSEDTTVDVDEDAVDGVRPDAVDDLVDVEEEAIEDAVDDVPLDVDDVGSWGITPDEPDEG